MATSGRNAALSTESNIRRCDSDGADPSTIQHKFLVGYQGWFTCHGDGQPIGEGHHGWLHWFTWPVPEGGNINIDLWPDTSDYSPSELFPAPGFKHENGDQAFLFSSRHPKTVQRHFHYMAQNGVDGAFLQRFVGQCDLEQGNHGIRRLRDEVGDRVKEAAEKEGRVFAIMYDVAGVQADRILKIIEEDWKHLVYEKGVLDSPNYLREKGKPVIAIWGFGFNDAHHTPEQMRAVTQFLRNATPGGAFLMAGTPTHWRMHREDADPNPEFPAAFMECFDAVSPWSVGRYAEQGGIDWFAENCIKPDIEFVENWERTKGKRVEYIPVVHPGGSAVNMSQGKWDINGAPRQGGRFLWRQLYNARRLGGGIIYGAMWDEFDEGTNFLPVVPHKNQLPHDEQNKFKFMAYDIDGYDIPADWYMRIAGYASEALKGERKIGEAFPEQEIKDWWASRPQYERGGAVMAGAGTSTAGTLHVVNTDPSKEPPPPPYTPAPGQGVQTVPIEKPAVPLSTRPSTSAAPPPQGQGQGRDASVSALADTFQQQSLNSPPPPVRPRLAPRSKKSSHTTIITTTTNMTGTTPTASPSPKSPPRILTTPPGHRHSGASGLRLRSNSSSSTTTSHNRSRNHNRAHSRTPVRIRAHQARRRPGGFDVQFPQAQAGGAYGYGYAPGYGPPPVPGPGYGEQGHSYRHTHSGSSPPPPPIPPRTSMSR
ncbi:hypothetical protein EVG20_g10314 [Dentipellis fragilis]|uniref:Xylosidase/arabinosidase n=1 Tax=Dentipellis fragilis TaxID=205917 RepID=A0A4Y9XT92_9AGAM|nr:hypothetical protein EVG20_g10314 [Dentipellis fragilis]